MKLNIQSMIRVSLAVSLIAVGARIQLPSIIAGYFTLQLPMVLISGIILTRKEAVIAISVYILGGLIGITWFASGGGISYLLQPTFGFIISFIPAVYIVNMGRDKSFVQSLILGILSTSMVWIIGMSYYYGISTLYLNKEMGYIPLLLSIFSLDLIVDYILTYFSILIGRRVLKGLEK